MKILTIHVSFFRLFFFFQGYSHLFWCIFRLKQEFYPFPLLVSLHKNFLRQTLQTHPVILKSIWITCACQYTQHNSRMSKSKSRCNILHCIATLSRSVLLKSKGCPLLSTHWDATEWYCRRLEVVVHRFFSK